MRSPLDDMDPLLVLRGIIHAWRERISFDRDGAEVPVPMRLLAMCADEMARGRDAAMLRACTDSSSQESPSLRAASASCGRDGAS